MGNDSKNVYCPTPQQEACRSEARALKDQIRASPVGVLFGRAPGQRVRVSSSLNCVRWARNNEALVCFEGKRGKTAVHAEFVGLEGHLAHNHPHVVGGVAVRAGSQESDSLCREVTKKSIFCPEHGVAWRTGELDPGRKEEQCLDIAEVDYEIRQRARQPHQGHVRVVHVGLQGQFLWGQFMLPHRPNPAVVILTPLKVPPEDQ